MAKFTEVKNDILLSISPDLFVSKEQIQNNETGEIYEEKVVLNKRETLFLKWHWEVQKILKMRFSETEFKLLLSSLKKSLISSDSSVSV